MKNSNQFILEFKFEATFEEIPSRRSQDIDCIHKRWTLGYSDLDFWPSTTGVWCLINQFILESNRILWHANIVVCAEAQKMRNTYTICSAPCNCDCSKHHWIHAYSSKSRKTEHFAKVEFKAYNNRTEWSVKVQLMRWALSVFWVFKQRTRQWVTKQGWICLREI